MKLSNTLTQYRMCVWAMIVQLLLTLFKLMKYIICYDIKYSMRKYMRDLLNFLLSFCTLFEGKCMHLIH